MERKLLALGKLVIDVSLQNTWGRDLPSVTITTPASIGYQVGEVGYAYSPAASVATEITDPEEIDAIIEALVDIKTFLVNSERKF